MMNENLVTIIGKGRFGTLLSKILKKHYKVQTLDLLKNPSSITKVKNSGIVIPAVPISALEDVVSKLATHLNPNTLVIDVCSVSEYPAKILQTYLSEHIDILSTHPMFGPDSTQNGKFFRNLKFIHYPIRIKNKARHKNFLKLWMDLGCELIEMTPEEHDMQAAYTHAYAFLVGKLGILLGVRKNQISTKGLDGVLYNQEAVERDTSQLFQDIFRYNTHAKEMMVEFGDAVLEIYRDLYS